ncbi:MAG TPA: DUF4494 domain-containing protein [Dyadobacter sp.]|jgi:hypothetical protein|nr:DUF4494 domain-containing protein [Dyadobacter sp.]
MASWYHGSIGYQKEDEAGALKVIQEQYLVDAISHTEAEARLNKQIVTGATDFEVKRIVPMKLADLFAYEEGEQWFKTKVIYFSVDEKSGKEKKVVNHMLVNATGIEQALERIKESMRNFLIPYEVEAVVLTKILDVFPYTSEEDNDEIISA